MFVYVVLKDAFELGWRRIGQYVDHLPETERDRDYNRVLRLIGGDDISALYRIEAGAETKPDGGKTKEVKPSTKSGVTGKDVVKTTFTDFRNWFLEYEQKLSHDHEIKIEHDEHGNEIPPINTDDA